MYLRKTIRFGMTLGMILPREYCSVLGLERGDYLEVFLQDVETIVIKKHQAVKQQISLTR